MMQKTKMTPEQWKQVDQLMDAAFELHPEQIAPFLDRECAGDQNLRQIMERLLAADVKAQSFIESRVLDAGTETVSPENLISVLSGTGKIESPFSSKGLLAERYQLVTKLGKGGMGEVWHAFDIRLRVDVALKALRLDLRKNPSAAELLRREVRTAREVISPNVCRIFDLVVVEQDLELISMEYIDGTTLLDHLSQAGPLELKQARDIAAQFLAGLEAIHHAGLVHRDLKPENIMITRTGRVVVMDFGISQRIAQMTGTVAGTLPYMSPEQMSGSNIDGRSDIFAAGVVLAEMIHTKGGLSEKTRGMIWHALRVDAKRIPDSPWKPVIHRAVSVNPEDRFQNIGELVRALEEVTLRVDGIDDQRPYPGLASFGPADAEYFFGREPEIETVIHAMRKFQMLAIIGPSGAGKTSFLRAGLLPTLPKDWCCIYTSPGDKPILNLAQSLARAIGDPGQFEDTEEAVGTFQRLKSSYKEIVLVVDRFEELFTLNPSPVQARYADILGRLLLEANVRIFVAMRDDFLIYCKAHDALRPIFSELTALLPLAGAALRRALVQPALRCGYRYEDETMVDQILADVENERGALPLIAFAAARLWEKRDRKNGLFTRQAYREIGGVSGAMAQYAEKILEQMTPEKQSIVREIFRNLVTAQNTRAARDVDELLSIFPEKDAAADALRVLIDSRLLTSFEAPSGEGNNSKRRVEIIHESLLSAWPRLVRWQTQDADSAQVRDQLRQASQVWEQRGRSVDLLWSGQAFLEYQAWRQRYSGRLTATEQAFADAMSHHAGRKRKKRQILIAGTFIALLSVLAIITLLWRNSSLSRDKAVAEAQRADASRMLAIARSLPDADPSTKVAFALRSLEFTDNPEARKYALQAMAEGLAYHRIQMEGYGAQMSPDGKWVAAGMSGGGMRLLPQDGSKPIVVAEPDSPSGHHIPWGTQFSPDSEFVLWTWRKNTSVIKVWSVTKRKLIRSFNHEGLTMCFVRGGKAFFITDLSGITVSPFSWKECAVRAWDFGAGDPVLLGKVTLSGQNHRSFDIDFRGKWIAYPKNNDVFVEDLQGLGTGTSPLVLKHSGEVRQIRFNPSKNGIAASNEKGEIRLWNLDHTNISEPARIIAGNGQPLQSSWFGPGGESFMAAVSGAILQWDLSAPEADPFLWVGGGHGARYDSKNRWFVMATVGSIDFYQDAGQRSLVFHGIMPNQSSANIRFTADGKKWITGFSEEGISIHPTPGEQSTARHLWNTTFWNGDSLDVDPLGRYVIAPTAGSGMYLVSLRDSKHIQLKGLSQDQSYSSATFSPDGNHVAAVGSNGVEVWDIANKNSRILEKSQKPKVSLVRYSPDGSLYSSDIEGNLKRWNKEMDTATGRGKKCESRYYRVCFFQGWPVGCVFCVV